jgi:acyl phosphate:glycerol-3-phosphate acyltransferase
VTLLAAVGLAYLIGAVPVGYLVGRAFGIGDIRRHGSGNIGATNVLRTAGRLPAVLTLVGDVVKGAAAVALGAAWAGGEGRAAAACAVAALVGNCWSIFLGFRGGKGGATGLGAFLALVPWAVLPAALVWLAVTMTFRYVSLATVASAACVPLGALALGYPRASVVACVLGAAAVSGHHRDNLARLTAGTERRLGQRAG